MARVIVVLVFVAIAAVLWKSIREVAHGLANRRAGRVKPDPEGYGWERKTDQIYRKVKAVSVPGEDREAILAFISSRRAVEAYMEPRTLTYPLSVVLVADDGEWKRFQLADDSFIRSLAGSQALPVFDAGKVGYPERMRKYKRERRPESGPESST
jgi:hypothetical protein